MDIKQLVVIDADQYPVRHISFPHRESTILLAASNKASNLRYEGSEVLLLVPTVPEAADTYLIIYLYNMLLEHRVEDVLIVSGDKKLVQMLIVTCSLFAARVSLHPCVMKKLGSSFTRSCAAMCNTLSITFQNGDVGRYTSVCNHIRKYRYGLKVGTLACHLSLPYGKTVELLESMLERQLIYQRGRTYFCH